MRKLENSELNRKTVQEFKSAKKTPIIIILENIRSLHNIGSVFRTADAFLIEKIYLCGFTATPPNREIRKTALGATESVVWEYVQDTKELIQRLKEQNQSVEIFAIEQAVNSINLDQFDQVQVNKLAVVFGNEVNGVEQQTIDCCDGVIEIPQLGIKHSLNVSVSAGIVIWDLYTKILKTTN